MPVRIGLLAPSSWVMIRVPSSCLESHTQPLPKRVAPLDSNSFLNASMLPHWAMICLLRVGAEAWICSSVCVDGAWNCSKYRLWLRIWPALLKIAPGLGAAFTISSRDLFSNSVPWMSLLRLST